MKYVVVKLKQGKGESTVTRELPIIFPEALSHSVVAQAFMRAIKEEQPNIREMEPVSAGFLSSMDINYSVYGKSDTLKLESREDQDNRLISTLDYTHGIVG